jgi:transcription-repair coupling factor (superfamily II helicase)
MMTQFYVNSFIAQMSKKDLILHPSTGIGLFSKLQPNARDKKATQQYVKIDMQHVVKIIQVISQHQKTRNLLIPK